MKSRKFKLTRFIELLLFFVIITFLCTEAKYDHAPGNEIAVLMYHNIIDRGSPDQMSVTQAKLYSDMKWLSEKGYQTVLPSELASLNAHSRTLQKNTVMIVFDDGYFSNYSLAYPILKKNGMKAAVMLITSMIRDEKPDGDPRVSYLTWDNVKEMSQSGLIEFGSHSDNLHNSSQSGLYNTGTGKSNGIQRLKGESKKRYQNRLGADIQKSISLIHEHTGKTVVSFAYPFGATDAWAGEILRQNGIRVTFLTGDRPADISHGFYNLTRIGIQEDTDIAKLLEAETD